MIDPSKLLTCAEFQARRDFYQLQRREQVLPQLKERQTALRREMDVLRMLVDWMGILPTKNLAWKDLTKAVTHNHRRESLLSAVVELSREYADVYGQVAVIENERDALTARVPEAWRVAFFDIGKVA